MMSPASYVERLKEKSYEELLIERKELLKEINDFEKKIRRRES